MPVKHIFLTLSLLWISSLAQAQVGNLVVNILNCKNDKGTLRVAVFKTEEGFPSDVSKAVQVKSCVIRPNASTLTFNGLVYGVYAVSVFHDENNNNKLDSNFIGIPSEGYGASRDAKNAFGPPKFEDAKFSIDSPTKMLNIKIRY
jgi:uncharacterized protein (DUF2141 family)